MNPVPAGESSAALKLSLNSLTLPLVTKRSVPGSCRTPDKTRKSYVQVSVRTLVTVKLSLGPD